MEWQSIVSQKGALRSAALAPFLDITVTVDDERHQPVAKDPAQRTAFRADADSKFQKITDIHSIPKLLEGLRSGEFSAEDVTLAYIRRYVNPF